MNSKYNLLVSYSEEYVSADNKRIFLCVCSVRDHKYTKKSGESNSAHQLFVNVSPIFLPKKKRHFQVARARLMGILLQFCLVLHGAERGY